MQQPTKKQRGPDFADPLQARARIVEKRRHIVLYIRQTAAGAPTAGGLTRAELLTWVNALNWVLKSPVKTKAQPIEKKRKLLVIKTAK